ncbi:MAG: hypothetical protein C5B59_08390 [Bacteroidetes bacterium]|nr:MAG: hypothetical protein C5B59_08390 [Bacteroidota bacterium]
MKILTLIIGLILLFAVEILRVYFIMPFPGSQHNNTIGIAYWLNNNIRWIRILLILIISYPVISILQNARIWKKILLGLVLIFYGVAFYFFQFRFQADKIFYQPHNKNFADAKDNKIPTDKLIIGVTVNGEAKAYPIQLIGYHHQVRDSIGHTPVMITYCTVCRTGRAFSPYVNNKLENFRLVGMDHFNAMFEDASTKSWWRQVSGEAIAGPLVGARLREMPSSQMTLASWLSQYPSSLILQRDTLFNQDYDDLADFDKGTIKGGLEKRDSASWKFKSWIVGVDNHKAARAYDWNELVSKGIIEDSLPGLPLLIMLEKDTASFHVWSRDVKGFHLQFVKNSSNANLFSDRNTESKWNMAGLCVEGPLKGEQLIPIQASQEFWHSWRTFHSATSQFKE